jgi:pimeloyl-ACP methyl ester carboxylesterase
MAVLAVDLPGHGRSAGPALPSIEAMAGWLRDLFDAAGVAQAAIVGHSMGSLIGLEFSAVAVQRLRKLALVGAALPMKVSDQLLEAARTDESAAFDDETWSHLSLNHQPGCRPGISVYMQARRLDEAGGPGVLHTDFNACNAYAFGFERAQALQVPALFILGQRDLMTPAKGRALAQKVRDARVIEVDGSGQFADDRTTGCGAGCAAGFPGRHDVHVQSMA